MFVVSGVMAQLIALKIHSQKSQTVGGAENKSFAAHATSHLEIHEKKAYKELLGLQRLFLGEEHRSISFQDVRKLLSATRALGQPPPATIILELPQRENGGVLPPFEELEKIRLLTAQLGIKLHMDGARLWECIAFYPGRTYRDIVELFDSVYVSFYKGVGAMTGAMLLGTSPFIQQARIWQRRFGGNLFTSLPYVTHAEMMLSQTLNTFKDRHAKLKLLCKGMTEEFGEFGMRFSPPVPHICQVHQYLYGSRTELEEARDQVVKAKGITVFSRIRASVGPECYIEWKMGPHNMGLPNALFIQGWRYFFQALHGIREARQAKEGEEED